MTKAFQTHQSQFGILIPVYPDSIQCRSAPISFLHLEWAQSSDSELISDVSRCLSHTKNVQDAHAREKKTREVQDNWRSVSNKSDPTHQLQWPRQSWNRLKTVHGLLVSRMFFNHYFCSPSLTIAKGYHKKKQQWFQCGEQWFHCWKKEVGSIGPSTVWEAITWNSTCSCKKWGL